MSQLLFSSEFVDLLKSGRDYSVAKALISFQQCVVNPKNYKLNNVCYWVIPQDILNACNYSEILNTIKINLETQAGYRQFFASNIKLIDAKEFGFLKDLSPLTYYRNNDEIRSPSICKHTDPECDGIVIRL